uniref:Secreted protein n=1 Tax=Octopus bimaculoides TaxID=37653 RepID=A0A0L8HAJ8_OCTBM
MLFNFSILLFLSPPRAMPSSSISVKLKTENKFNHHRNTSIKRHDFPCNFKAFFFFGFFFFVLPSPPPLQIIKQKASIFTHVFISLFYDCAIQNSLAQNTT